jgi:hypothetical protein
MSGITNGLPPHFSKAAKVNTAAINATEVISKIGLRGPLRIETLIRKTLFLQKSIEN